MTDDRELLELAANQIAEIILNTGTEYRGILLDLVAKVLITKTQYFTATIIQSAAVAYGLSDTKEDL